MTGLRANRNRPDIQMLTTAYLQGKIRLNIILSNPVKKTLTSVLSCDTMIFVWFSALGAGIWRRILEFSAGYRLNHALHKVEMACRRVLANFTQISPSLYNVHHVYIITGN
ncbi:MAG: hypothetical protein FWG65_00135 [Turicibacter sp.]|nr:hypothetical protein [Turicibacter sp.]